MVSEQLGLLRILIGLKVANILYSTCNFAEKNREALHLKHNLFTLGTIVWKARDTRCSKYCPSESVNH